jgi:hypothetical protein
LDSCPCFGRSTGSPYIQSSLRCEHHIAGVCLHVGRKQLCPYREICPTPQTFAVSDGHQNLRFSDWGRSLLASISWSGDCTHEQISFMHGQSPK